MICSVCRPEVQTCPQCRGRLRPEARLYFAERLLDKVPIPCQYSSEGCQVELTRERLEQHEAACQYREVACTHQGCRARLACRKLQEHQAACRYRPITCPVTSCNVKVSLHLLMLHLYREHNMRQESLATNLMSLPTLLTILLALSVAVNISLLFL